MCPGTARYTQLAVRLSKNENFLVELALEKLKRNRSDWARDVILSEARKVVREKRKT